MMIKAIETVYNGYKFRSRLEARWAVFFDSLGLKYEYEKEGYDLGDNIYYLPDFWLPTWQAWVEVKPQFPDEEEFDKMCRLAAGTRYPVYCEPGLDYNSEGFLVAPTTLPDESVVFYGGYITICETCNQPAIQLRNVYDKAKGKLVNFDNNKYLISCPNCGLLEAWSNLVTHTKSAYEAARQARFEHGQNGH